MKRPAFTILELLIALSLFLIGMVTVIEIFPADRNLLTETTYSTQAAYLAQQEIETMIATPYTSLTTGTYVAKSPVTTDSGSPYSIFDQQVTVDYLDTNRNVSTTDYGLKRITVTIYWSVRTISQQYTLVTYVYNL